MAGFEDDVNSMPMGMHTVIAEGAGTLAGGQKQRLMIARAIVRRPRILLFDEATSALDNTTQAIVAHSVEQLNATRIVIAHRLSTIVKAGRIFVIDAGRVVETGNYAELMARNGPFAELAKRQIA
jgi:ATP-binding cassette subfamily C protein